MRPARQIAHILTDCSGRGTIGCLFAIILLGAAIIAGVRVGPPFFAYKSLEADVSTEVSRAGAHFYNDDVLVQDILDVAKKNGVVVKKEDIQVARFAGQVQVSFHYAVPLDLIFFQHTIDFSIKASSYIGTL